MSKALWKVILIPPDQRCLVFVYFENLWEVNTPPCSEAQTDYWCLVSSWIKAMSTHSVSPAYITEPPLTPITPFVSYLRHRHKVGYTHRHAITRTVFHCCFLCLFCWFILLCWNLNKFGNLSIVGHEVFCWMCKDWSRTVEDIIHGKDLINFPQSVRLVWICIFGLCTRSNYFNKEQTLCADPDLLIM